MDLIDIARADQTAFAVGTRTREIRRQYHELRKIERLERALRVAKTRLSFATTASQAG